MVVSGITDAYNKYGRYEHVWDICKDVLGKLWKGISYADYLQQGS